MLSCACEWDPLPYHTAERVETDVKKTVRLLRSDSGLLVVRVRVGAPPLPPQLTSHPRCIVVDLDAGTSIPEALQQFGRRVCDRVKDPFVSRLRDAHGKKRPLAEVEVHNLYCRCDVAYREGYASMEELLGPRNAEVVEQRVHGVRRNVKAIALFLGRVQTTWGMTKEDMCKFMGNSVAAAMVSDKASVFWAGLETLRTTWGMTKEDMCKFMCDSVAAAMVSDKASVFWAGLETLRTTWGMTKVDLCKFMGGSVAAAMVNDKASVFWAGLETLRTTWGMTKVDLCKFMCDSVAAAMVSDKASVFWAGLETLRGADVAVANFVCGGIAARLQRGDGSRIAAVVARLGPKQAKTLLRKQPLLQVLPELVAYLERTRDDELREAIASPAKRKVLNAALRASRQ